MCILKLFSLLLLIAAVMLYQQDDYILTSERAEIAGVNKEYATARIFNFRYNRTCKAINATFTIKRNVGNELEAEVQAYRFASNEYRLFPLAFKVQACDTFSKNEFGMRNMFKCGNFTGCPLAKGDYHLCNWTPDYTKFPPYIPAGDYRLDLHVLFFGKSGIDIQWYLKVEKKVKYR